MNAIEIEDIESGNDRQVALTRVGEMVVSTIKLSELLSPLDEFIASFSDLLGYHERADLSTPGAYESMVFSYSAWTERGQGMREFDFRRYETEEEARQGHQELVEKWKEMPAFRQEDA